MSQINQYVTITNTGSIVSSSRCRKIFAYNFSNRKSQNNIDFTRFLIGVKLIVRLFFKYIILKLGMRVCVCFDNINNSGIILNS